MEMPKQQIPFDLKDAKSGCKHCYGTGICGTRVVGKQRQSILCKCVVMAARKKAQEKKP